MMMISNLRKQRFMLPCHAFASNANRQQRHGSKHSLAMTLKRTRSSSNNYSWVVRGGGAQPFSSSKTESTIRLSSTASPLKESSSVNEKDEFEKRVLNSLAIASGSTTPVSKKSFGGLSYQDTSSSDSSSLFRVVFVLGGPGKTVVELLIIMALTYNGWLLMGFQISKLDSLYSEFYIHDGIC